MEIITVVLSIFALIISFISLYSSWKVQTANESQIRADRNISIDCQLGLYGKPIAELHGINLDEAEKHSITKEAISYLVSVRKIPFGGCVTVSIAITPKIFVSKIHFFLLTVKIAVTSSVKSCKKAHLSCMEENVRLEKFLKRSIA